MASRSGSPFAGAPSRVPGAPRTIPGAPLSVPGGPVKSGLVPGSRIGSGYSSFLTTVPDQPTSGQFRDMHTKQIRNFQGRYSGPVGIAWQGLDSLSEGLFDYGKRVDRARQKGMEQLAKEMVAWAKENAPWEDDTGNARANLQAHVVHGNGRSVIWFGHGRGVPYGIWLEIMQNGRFAIVLPTVLKFAPKVGGKVAAHV